MTAKMIDVTDTKIVTGTPPRMNAPHVWMRATMSTRPDWAMTRTQPADEDDPGQDEDRPGTAASPASARRRSRPTIAAGWATDIMSSWRLLADLRVDPPSVGPFRYDAGASSDAPAMASPIGDAVPGHGSATGPSSGPALNHFWDSAVSVPSLCMSLTICVELRPRSRSDPGHSCRPRRRAARSRPGRRP